ncbi:hypothetical protein [Staphylococcus aureus]|uniref:hypothetical protein n=1 Tax=Staphylococcus aureus TaxID=1280 RepID=UPI00226F45F1|nr:hypothetical protein [Staphylococcus aureus]
MTQNAMKIIISPIRLAILNPPKIFFLEIIYFCCVVKPLQQAGALRLQGFQP